LEKFNGIIKLKVCYFDMSEFNDLGDWKNQTPTRKTEKIENILYYSRTYLNTI